MYPGLQFDKALNVIHVVNDHASSGTRESINQQVFPWKRVQSPVLSMTSKHLPLAASTTTQTECSMEQAAQQMWKAGEEYCARDRLITAGACEQCEPGSDNRPIILDTVKLAKKRTTASAEAEKRRRRVRR